ncbi:hypothetical protein DJ013_11095 [Arcticibacterium luteifluviistationis]|uniref:Secretion system C-terminal sorting domain-containing protein n=2 Tax=Arcticibacterium luteifluviistationis TaxID=1784714 RepID=A0A2Z4GC99_9BACT|nr:hypothetical protein DJ013_11095 [Arcticibacterium luteifluviistationis]
MDWSTDTPAYPDAATSHTYTNVNGLSPARSVSVSVSNGSTMAFSANYPRVVGSDLSWGVNASTNSTATSTSTYTIIFSHPACGLTFDLSDIDLGGSSPGYDFVDEVVISATNSASAPIANPTISVATENSVVGNVITGTSSGSPTNTITFGGASASDCVKTLTLIFRTGADVKSNPNAQQIAIGPMTSATGGAPFAVNYTSFDGKARTGAISLNWQTSSETNNQGFEVQKSRNAVSFETISRIDGAGDSQDLNSYNFTDEQPFTGSNYYRLKQKDFDGTVDYSKIIQVYFDVNGSFVSLHPNPLSAGQALNIQKSESLELNSIRNVMGQNFPASSNLKEGLYFLQFTSSNGEKITKKLVVN